MPGKPREGLDAIDLKILKSRTDDAERLDDLVKRLGIAKSTVTTRIRRLQDMGELPSNTHQRSPGTRRRLSEGQSRHVSQLSPNDRYESGEKSHRFWQGLTAERRAQIGENMRKSRTTESRREAALRGHARRRASQAEKSK